MLGKKKLFGNNISVSCDYCTNCVVEGNTNFCRYKKSINAKGKCSKFKYDPIMRKVASTPALEKFKAEDFTL